MRVISHSVRGRPGVAIPLDEHYTERPDTLPGLTASLVAGSAVALVPAQAVERVAWIDASTRASLLDGLATAAEQAGLDPGEGAELAAGRFLGWLARTSQPWLVVLDDLRDAAAVGARGRLRASTHWPDASALGWVGSTGAWVARVVQAGS